MSDTNYPPAEVEAIQETETALAVVPHEQIIRPTTTAAQAKVEAVANLTFSAYARAATLEITEEESDALSADFPDEAFKPGAAGKEHLIYIEHAFLRDRFAQVFGMGQWAIVPRSRWAEEFRSFKGVEGSRVYVEAMLIVRGCFVGEAVGAMEYYPSNAAQNYGDAVEGAKTAAFRRCAKEFGIGLQAWKKDWCEGWWERKNAQKRPPAPAGRSATPAPPSTPTPPAPPPPAKSEGPKPPLTIATSNTRAAALDRLGCQEEGVARNTLHSYLVALGWLQNEKTVEQWPVRFVPLSADELEAFKVGLASFSLNSVAVAPYEPHGMDPALLQATPVTPVAPPPPGPELPPAAPNWRDYVLTFGKSTKGKALGSFTEPDLLNYIQNFVVREWVEDAKGVKQFYAPAIVAEQKALRAALDQAAAEFAAKKG